jgi:F-type H+-transporting ATPase subunit delta
VKENIVAGRYAQALFAEAKTDGKIQDIIDQLKALGGMYDSSADFRILVKSPLIKKSEKQAVMDQLKNKGVISDYLYRFVTLLVSKNRLSLLNLIAEQVVAMDMRDRGEAEAYVTVAAAMDEASRKTLVDVLSEITGKKITIRETVDASILGGVIAQVESSLYDASVRGQLNRMKEQLV